MESDSRVVDRRILIAADDGPIQHLVARALRRYGYNVRTAVDGADALKQFKFQLTHLLIIDLDMPNMNGLEFCQQIRLLSDVPIIVMTGHGRVMQTVVSAGVDAFLIKPFDLDQMLEQVDELLITSKVWTHASRGEEASSEEMFSVSDAARILEVHPNTLRRWSNQELITFHRVGRRGDRMFRYDDLVRYYESRRSRRREV